jgi:hypothetical protein
VPEQNQEESTQEHKAASTHNNKKITINKDEIKYCIKLPNIALSCRRSNKHIIERKEQTLHHVLRLLPAPQWQIVSTI